MQNGKTGHTVPKTKMNSKKNSASLPCQMQQDSVYDSDAAQTILDAYQATHISSLTQSPLKRQKSSHSTTSGEESKTPSTSSVDAYFQARGQLCQTEASIAFDHRCRLRASPLEQTVDSIIHRLRKRDEDCVYAAAKPRRGQGGQLHPRFAGDHFLSNTDLINQTALFDVAHNMPKGAHLHIHFNACLPPEVLLGIAKSMDRMFISSNLPLVADNEYENFAKCEIQFSLLSIDKEDDAPGNVFDPEYQSRQTMKLSEFASQFPRLYPGVTADEWLLAKLVFSEEEAHGPLQTAAG